MQGGRLAPADTVIWGWLSVCDHPDAFAPGVPDVIGFVRSAPWYRGLPPPYWKLGGRGEMNYQGRGTGDGRWFFMTGGCWLMRTDAVRTLDWPDKRLGILGDDVFLGEAIRQQGWGLENIPNPGVAISAEPRRWDTGRGQFRPLNNSMERQRRCDGHLDLP